MKFARAGALASLVPGILPLTVNTLSASVTFCEPLLISWVGGTPPYYLSFVPPGQVNAPPLKTFPPQNGYQTTWLVDLSAGTSFKTSIMDSTGAQAYSADTVTIEAPGAGTTCSISTTGTGSPIPTRSAGGF
ncbi:hypothetical protein K443DRAFT_167 [Laccaria amethystina LaAM-08-1]|uniref:Uncharacterized protein n=1 Tax=Laccaria amethystina LaAM-08-1 TaxID=1095629 RepID=A0A0C9XZ13_9AGAR|nr:hypothetical protein K443DRAFT_167 [Laccaria amethystina LaAM-08-1]